MAAVGGAFAAAESGFVDGHTKARGLFKERGRVVEKLYSALPFAKRHMRKSNGWRALVKTIVKVVRLRDGKDGPSAETQLYGCSASINALEAKALIEGHWQVENQLHQRLDRALGEDAARKSKFAAFRALAGMAVHNILRMNMPEGKQVGWRLMLERNKMRPREMLAWRGVSR